MGYHLIFISHRVLTFYYNASILYIKPSGITLIWSLTMKPLILALSVVAFFLYEMASNNPLIERALHSLFNQLIG